MRLKLICTFHTAYAEITKKIIHRKNCVFGSTTCMIILSLFTWNITAIQDKIMIVH